MVSRTEGGTLIGRWWWTVDRYLLFSVIALMITGFIFSFAASPPVAERLGLDSYHFVKRHAVFMIPSLVIFLGVSLLSPKQVRRLALLVFLGGVALMIVTLFIGLEIKGARRWISVGGFSLQPSEFVKPALIILSGWLFAEHKRQADIPGNIFAILLLVMVVSLLVAQPDFGQTALVGAAWGMVFFMAGLSWTWIFALAGLGVIGGVIAYLTVAHVAGRINRFLDPSSGDTFQVDTAIDAFVKGGWFGRGPGEGTVKRILPDSHTDFIFAVAAEEFGIIVCLLLLAIMVFVVMRGLYQAQRLDDAFHRLATFGLVSLFGLQVVINLGVNLKLMPAKGMTLPFISYGGSSMLSAAFVMGVVLAFTRSKPVRSALRHRQPLARSEQVTKPDAV
ncbi:putative lipid II flippase FtsW [Coralliovum pocilloporae]|uniref:putative lipid II flippase FtsW n=1 Tax=Coralliovum pocilloporae TaxID=3066369 RepID=UPI0033070E04